MGASRHGIQRRKRGAGLSDQLARRPERQPKCDEIELRHANETEKEAQAGQKQQSSFGRHFNTSTEGS
jgi:hypothetical protein